MRAVADSSVLIALCVVGQLELLPLRFPEGILIPRAVWREVVEVGEGQPGATAVASASWVEVCDVEQGDLVSVVGMELDRGETEAIVLARQQDVSLILLDDKAARRVARRLSLRVLGTVGVLLWATRAGIIDELRVHLDKLRTVGRFRLSQSVYEAALAAVGER